MGNGAPDVDELVAVFHEGFGFLRGRDMATDARRGCAGGLVYVDLLDGLARGGGVVFADSVVEDDDFFDLVALGEVCSEGGFDLGVVPRADGVVVGEGRFFGRGDVHGETRDVGAEVLWPDGADVGYGAAALSSAERAIVDVDFGPWFGWWLDACRIEVTEDAGRHFRELLLFLDCGHF